MLDARLTWIADFCRQHRLTEKWLLAPSFRAGHQWKEQINRGDQPTINLHVKTLRSIVFSVLAQEPEFERGRMGGAALCELLLQSVVGELQDQMQYLSRLDSLEGVSSVIFRSITDLRLAGITPDEMKDSHFENAEKAADMRLIMREYAKRLSEQQIRDYADCLQRMTDKVSAGHTMLDQVRMLLVDDHDFCQLERGLIGALESRGVVCRPEPQNEIRDPLQRARAKIVSGECNVDIAMAMGETNEVQAALRQLSMQGRQLDGAELLHTDYGTYVPLIHEYFASIGQLDDTSVDRIPVTFAEGIACVYSRPGRALRSWLRWIGHDCPQPRLVRMIREGLIQLDDGVMVHGQAQLASQLRRLPIGFGRDRYAVQINAAIAVASQRTQQAIGDLGDGRRQRQDSDYGRAILKTLQDLVVPLIEDSPARNVDDAQLLSAAERFLGTYARQVTKLDRYATRALLDRIAAMRDAIAVTNDLDLDLWSWLQELPVACRVLASGPAPGCLHVDHLLRGGHSGREHTLIVGLDDSRFPIRGGQDPLLLDQERIRVSQSLPNSVQTNLQNQTRFRQLISRAGSHLTLIFSQRSLAEDKTLFPSSALLELFRELTGKLDASEHDLQQAAGEPVCFSSAAAVELKSYQTQLRELLSEPDLAARQLQLESSFAHWHDGRLAQNVIDDPESFSEFDGLVEAAGFDIDPTHQDAKAVSASSLESFGACPRRYFFQRALKIYPPDELVLEEDRWLDSMTLGGLVHKVFEVFLIELTKADRTPEFPRDRERILKLLDEQIGAAETRIPITSRDAYRRQRRDLEKTCEIFLREEQKYCRETGAKPFVMEATIGTISGSSTVLDSANPVELSLADGRRFLAGGIIDRVDRIDTSDSSFFSIWDYKSGSDWGFDEADPFQSGRKLQPYLYVGLLKHRLASVVGAGVQVRQFGYFFSSPKTNGRRIQWITDDLNSADQLLGRIFDLIGGGCFVATTEQSDCRYCDYLGICGDPEQTVNNTMRKLESADHPMLDIYRELRSGD